MKNVLLAIALTISMALGGGAFAAPADGTPAAVPNGAHSDDAKKQNPAGKAQPTADGEGKSSAVDSRADGAAKTETGKEHDNEDGKEKEKPKKGAKAKPYPLETCIVTDNKLGAMGDEVTMVHEGQEIKFCCKPCKKKFEKEPARYLPKLNPHPK